MMFAPTRNLLNPKFEGYKLDLISRDDVVARYPLEYKPTQATVSGSSTFSFQEVQSRITHNHLAVWSETGRAIYVDSDARVIAIDIDAETVHPTFRVLHELPVPTTSGAVETLNREYPSAVFLSSSLAFVADGYGTMYVLQVKNSGSSTDVLGTYTLSPISMEIPFRIHSVHRLSPTVVIAILSSRHYEENANMEPQGQERGKRPPPDFDVWAVKIELLSLGPRENIRQLDIIWCRRGQDVPIYTSHQEFLNSFILIGGTTYREVDRLSLVYEPSPDDIAPIPRADENVDSRASEQPKPLPYAWSQTPDSVTVAIPLPSSTLKSNIKVTFSQRTLTVHIDSDVPSSVPIPRYSAKLLWDGMLSSTSYWTWDREAEHSFGLLTLYLDKQHEGTKWSQVFASASTSTASDSSFEMEVPETLDPSELWHIREALEKYTTSLREGNDASGLGLGRGVPSLAEGEMDAEVDESVGREACLTWVGADGSVPAWWKESESIPFHLLATPMPGSDESRISLVVKNNLDGTVHSLISDASDLTSPEWTHTSTFNALAFVLASKQDTRFTYHIPGIAVFAFEGGVRDRGGNVYIYRAAPAKEKCAKQAILKVGDGYGGSLLGVGAVECGQGATVLVCLTEGELILLKYP